MTETIKQRIERETREQLAAMKGQTMADNTDAMKALQEKYDRLLTAYHAMCDRATVAEAKIKNLRLTRKEDGLWLYVHSTTHNTDALILIHESRHGSIVNKTINGYLEENPS